MLITGPLGHIGSELLNTLNKFKHQNSLSDENLRYQIENKILEIVEQYYDLLNKQNIYKETITHHYIQNFAIKRLQVVHVMNIFIHKVYIEL